MGGKLQVSGPIYSNSLARYSHRIQHTDKGLAGHLTQSSLHSLMAIYTHRQELLGDSQHGTYLGNWAITANRLTTRDIIRKVEKLKTNTMGH